MKVLLDECIPRKLKNSFVDHDCETVSEAGFAGANNGILLALAEAAGFQILITMDKGIQYEQNLSGRRICVLLIGAKSNRLADLLPHVPACLRSMSNIQPGKLIRMSVKVRLGPARLDR